MEAITKWLESNYIDYDGEDLDYDSEVLKKIYYKTIYEEVFENGKKIAQLSRETGISYYSLYNTVRHIKKQIQEESDRDLL
jgi:Mor family transcriptional regulator